MSHSTGLQYEERILPTESRVLDIEALLHQEAVLNGSKQKRRDGDQPDLKIVSRLSIAFRRYPRRYSCYILNDRVVGFMKLNTFNLADEYPYTRGIRRHLYKVLLLLAKVFRKLTRYKINVTLPTGKWAVFELIVSNDLSERDQRFIIHDLLRKALVNPETNAPRTVIIFNDNEADLRLEVAKSMEFVKYGKPELPASSPGADPVTVKQQRYIRHPHY